jgi:hypothetical protein
MVTDTQNYEVAKDSEASSRRNGIQNAFVELQTDYLVWPKENVEPCHRVRTEFTSHVVFQEHAPLILTSSFIHDVEPFLNEDSSNC